ncbi:MAG: four helix bundle protein [Chlamydiales bacterium]
MDYFDHEKLDVYQAAIELVVLINSIVQQFPKGRAYLADQFQRAGTSVPLNIAEGAGEFSSAEKGKFYRIAKRSATECAGIFDICRRLYLLQESQYLKGRELLIRIVAMLTKMAKGTSFVPAPVPAPVPACVPDPSSH